MSAPDIEWVLFDWGNVLVEYRPLGFARLGELLGVGAAEVGGFLSESGILAALCDGRMQVEEGLDRFEARFGHRLTHREVVEACRADVETVLPGIEQLLDELEGVARLAILSNTFFGHWDSFVGTPLYERFELPMASHLLGGVKPDPGVYEAALGRMGADAARVVFVDDKQENLETAERLGMHTVLSHCSVDATRDGLQALLGRRLG